MNRRVLAIKALVVAVLAISANVFASPADELTLQRPVLLGKVTSFSNTCRLIIIDTDNQKHELDPATLGEAERKAGHYNINPYVRFAGIDNTFQHIDSSKCIAIAGRTASERGIQQVIMTYDRSNEVTVSVPESYVDNRRGARTNKCEFTVRDGCDYSKSSCRINSTMRFLNINPRSKEWSQSTINDVRGYF
ncbi:MAG: hypothetical protein WC208_02750 [Gallionella sp.]